MVLTPRRLEVGIALFVLLLDQLTKALVRAEFALFESTTIIPGFFDLTRVHNTGAAFGFMNVVEFRYKTAVLSLVAGAALAGLAVYSATIGSEQWLTRLGLAAIIGGAAGNLIDRLTAGYVLDFVDLYWRGWHFWAFNVADAAITAGVALLVLDIIGVGRQRVSGTV
jgi:signal peptidase II